MKNTLSALLLSAAWLAAAPIQVTLDTSSLNGQTGTVDIQFNPGNFPAVYSPGTATITSFNLGAGTLGSIAFGPDGGASGTLPGPLTIINSDFLNGIVYNATFGSTASFRVDFSGSAFTGSGQSVLTTLSVMLNGTANSVAAQADLIGGGRLDTSSSSTGVTFAPTATVPEPSSYALFGLGCLAILARLNRPRKLV